MIATSGMAPSPTSREFTFLELFAGWAGFSGAVERVNAGSVLVLEPLEEYYGWDVLSESGFDQAKAAVLEASHVHIAFPCHSFTRARRSDQHGAVEQVRSDKHPEGWGHPVAEKGNAILVKAVALAWIALDNGATVSLENPWSSFAWELKLMKRLMKKLGRQPLELHQCAYGAETQKPTGILTNAPWMEGVVKHCTDVREHYHRPGGLTGKVWDPRTNEMIWRTSRAAEYPAGLCMAWAKSLQQWLASDAGRKDRERHTFVRVGARGNVLVRASLKRSLETGVTIAATEPRDVVKEASKAETRERQNAECVGGLRDPRRAVARSSKLRKVGMKLRMCLDSCLDDRIMQGLENSTGSCPFDESLIAEGRGKLASAFQASVKNGGGYQDDLIQKILEEAQDPDAQVVPKWMREGFPLGITRTIENTGVFPRTDEVSASIKASQVTGALLEDWDGTATNYSSFVDAGPKAESELDRLVTEGRATLVTDWHEVVRAVGPKAKLTKLACIIKMKGDLEKVRLVVDMRRSGINGMMQLFERVVLPRVSDVAESLRHVLQDPRNFDKDLEFMIADFSDAFLTLKLHPDERQWVVIKGPKGFYLVHAVCFGLACGPVLWGRVAAVAMRLGQAATHDTEGRSQCYVDDPLLLALGKTSRERSRIFARFVFLWTCLGYSVAWHKISRGAALQWIGVSLTLHSSERRLIVELASDKVGKLLDAFAEIKAAKGMISTARLRHLAGLLSWISNLVPSARPWTSMVWAAVHSGEGSQRSRKADTRQRKGLTYVKQVLHAVTWLESMVRASSEGARTLESSGIPPMKHVYDFNAEPPVFLIQTDACPEGVGAVLFAGGKIATWFSEPLTNEDMLVLGVGARVGDPAYQTEFEMYCVILAVRAFAPHFKGQHIRFFLQTDNNATLRAALDLKSKSPLLTFLASELVVTLTAFNIAPLWGRHLPGILNDLADALSRNQVPAVIQGSPRCRVPARAREQFRVLPSAVE